MNTIRKYNIKKILQACLWSLLGLAGLFLLVSALYKRDAQICKGININLNGSGNYFFIDSSDILNIIKIQEGNNFIGKPVRKFDLGKTEKELMKDVWIRKAQLYFDNNGLLTAEIIEREPVARVFTSGGSSFYIDNEKNMLPLSERHAARLPMFSNFPSELKVLSKYDSSLLEDIKSLSIYIQNDNFLMAMIDQVNINTDRQFELVPKIGDQIIIFGDAADMEAKFNKMKLFYNKVIPDAGWSKYNKIDLQYKGQIVARINAASDVTADSLRTMEMMKALATMSTKMASDSFGINIQKSDSVSNDVSLILQSFQRDEEVQDPVPNDVSKTNTANAQPQTKPVTTKTVPKPVLKKVQAPAAVKPKAVKPVQSKLKM